MKKLSSLLLLATLVLYGCKNKESNSQNNHITITPIEHATLILSIDSTNIYVDPVGKNETFKNERKPDLILVTDIHGDHLSIETLNRVTTAKTKIVAPEAVYNKLPQALKLQTTVLKNLEHKSFSINQQVFNIKAIPMYNLRAEALKFHEKSRGNGYVLTIKDKRIYISGDTEDIPEMRQLKNIDIAFVCMNLPYTMPVESAASAVLDFTPKKVYPYHFKGTNGFRDVAKFKSIINKENKDIEVEILNWYSN
ncbi:MBL fold metallo-hydrolase [Mangrovimonas spongiae]|uniref:MBL fold metallo-hydrolase n=1 Tax=Mangrovimonas spongiae TaxID=2494697 RepID=A0A428JWN6_9FLAO|nr:MBL fold metallo-hydrolase [Mangrovimonas spongiae]RSK38592.1 MBL fold metallo-hydrolase [Mangrovimonas spongiae]